MPFAFSWFADDGYCVRMGEIAAVPNATLVLGGKGEQPYWLLPEAAGAELWGEWHEPPMGWAVDYTQEEAWRGAASSSEWVCSWHGRLCASAPSRRAATPDARHTPVALGPPSPAPPVPDAGTGRACTGPR